MREANFAFPSQNRACVCITSALYDRRALDTTAALPLLNSLTHLTYLTSTSPRIREILTLDGGLERLLHILRNSSIPRPPPPPPDLFGLSIQPAIPASTGLLSPDRAVAYRFSLAFQCVSNVGVRGSEQIRTRVVQAGVLDVVAQVLEVWLRSRGMSTEAGPSGSGQPLNLQSKGDGSGARSSRRAGGGPPPATLTGPVPRPGAGGVQVASTLNPDGSLAVHRQAGPGGPFNLVSSPQSQPQANAARGAGPSPRPPPAVPAAPGPSLIARAFAAHPEAAADSSRPSSATSEARGGGSFPNSGDETSVHSAEIDMGDETARDLAALAASDEETARLAQSASNLLQSMASSTPFVASRSGISLETTPRSGPQTLSSRSPAPSFASGRRPSPIRSSSTSTMGTDSEVAGVPVPVQPRQLDNLSRPALTGNASEASSAGGSNVSTPMGTPTGTGLRERSGTLLARPTPTAPPPARRRRRERTSTPGNDSATTGGEDDGGDMLDGEDEEGASEGGAGGPAVPPASQEVNIVQEEDGVTDIEGGMDDDTIEGNMDLQMGAPPGAPGAANTPGPAPDMTPRQAFLPMTAAVLPVQTIGPSVTSPVAQTAAEMAAPAAATPGRLGTTTGGFGGTAGMTTPAVAALATAQATQRTLRDLSLEGNTMSPSETTYRDDDILLSLQLLAYLSKYPHVRQAFHKPRQPFHPNLELDEHNPAPLPMRPALSDTPNIFSLVERFTFRPSPSDPTTPQLPDEIVYWAGVIMRNACRKDESRGGIRQCANMSCGKWETSPRQFAKCRRCRKAKYCSKECQSKAWSEGHRFWCSQRGETEVPATESSTAAQPGTLGSLTGLQNDGQRAGADGATRRPVAAGGQQAPPTGTRGPRPTAGAPPATRGGGGEPYDLSAEAAAAARRANPPISVRAPSVDHTMDVDADPRQQAVPPTPRPAPIVRASTWASTSGTNPALGNPEDVNGVPLLAPGSATFRAPHQSRTSPQGVAADLLSAHAGSRGGPGSPTHSRQAGPSTSASGSGGLSSSGSAFSRITSALPRLYNFGSGGGHAHEAAAGAALETAAGGDHSAARRSLFRALGSSSTPAQAPRDRTERRAPAPAIPHQQQQYQSPAPPLPRSGYDDAEMTG